MKIAIATEYNDPAAEVSNQGARALFFHIYDAEGKLQEILENPYAGNASHVGSDVANMLCKLLVTEVVAGRFGHNFAAELQALNVERIEDNGFAAQVARTLAGGEGGHS